MRGKATERSVDAMPALSIIAKGEGGEDDEEEEGGGVAVGFDGTLESRAKIGEMPRMAP